jgi:hypothetical protein
MQKTLVRGWHVGLKLVAQGDTDYRAYQLGAFVGDIRLGADSAVSKSEDDLASAYARAEFYFPSELGPLPGAPGQDVFSARRRSACL